MLENCCTYIARSIFVIGSGNYEPMLLTHGKPFISVFIRNSSRTLGIPFSKSYLSTVSRIPGQINLKLLHAFIRWTIPSKQRSRIYFLITQSGDISANKTHLEQNIWKIHALVRISDEINTWLSFIETKFQARPRRVQFLVVVSPNLLKLFLRSSSKWVTVRYFL